MPFQVIALVKKVWIVTDMIIFWKNYHIFTISKLKDRYELVVVLRMNRVVTCCFLNNEVGASKDCNLIFIYDLVAHFTYLSFCITFSINCDSKFYENRFTDIVYNVFHSTAKCDVQYICNHNISFPTWQ